ncbi:sulfurtransferase [Humibacter sp.]|uniref:sulfurtransferase n=1 Tax=Humibacter sp. TaxID=1940291 RepID=UPI003F816D90
MTDLSVPVSTRGSAQRLPFTGSATARRHLVSTEELAQLLDQDEREARLVVVDATVVQVQGFDGHPAYVTGHEQYLVGGHIPGAVFADLLEEFSDAQGPFGFARPDADRFARGAVGLGVDADTFVVVYDDSVGQWAARLWWLFRSFGHECVAVLDGGLRKWAAEERPLEIGHVTPTPSSGYVAAEGEGFWVDKERVLRAVTGQQPALLVCGLPPREFTGESGHRPRLGHIPGSVSAPASRLVDRATNALLPDDALRALLADAVASPDPVVAYCAGGVAASADALALAVLGRDDVAVYDGSLNEWAADPDAPLETVPAAG